MGKIKKYNEQRKKKLRKSKRKELSESKERQSLGFRKILKKVKRHENKKRLVMLLKDKYFK